MSATWLAAMKTSLIAFAFAAFASPARADMTFPDEEACDGSDEGASCQVGDECGTCRNRNCEGVDLDCRRHQSQSECENAACTWNFSTPRSCDDLADCTEESEAAGCAHTRSSATRWPPLTAASIVAVFALAVLARNRRC